MSYESTKARRTELLDEARSIAEKARDEGRGLTEAEQSTIEGNVAEARKLRDSLAAHAKSANVFAALDAMAAGGAHTGGHGAKRLTFAGMAEDVTAKIAGDGLGAKALAPSGATVVAQEFAPDPVALGQPATALLDVLPVTTHTTAQFSYLRQTARTNNAAVVADAALKPTSVYGVVRVDDQLDVVAHLSEGIPRYWLSDNAALTAWLNNELAYGLAAGVEALAWSTILGTSGVQTNAYSTSALVTLRKSLTKLEQQGHQPSAFVVNPTDWESVELALSTVNAVEHLSLPYDPAARRLYGVPVAVSTAADTGTALTLSAGSVGLHTDTLGVQVSWSETSNADDWAHNLIRARAEGRYAVSVPRPLGVVLSTLTSA